MAYALVDFNAAAAEHERNIDAAKLDGSYAAKQKAFDQAVLKDAAALVKAALAVTDDYAKKVTERHKVCKAVIEQMEGILKKKAKTLDASDMKVMETAARSVKNHSDTLADTSSEAFKALTQYRGAWPATFRKLMSTPAALEPLINARLKSIDEGKQIDTLKQRVGQYVERAQDILKTAQKLAAANSGAEAQPGVAAEDIKVFNEAVAALKFEAEKFLGKANNSLKQLADTDPKVKPDATGAKMNESRLTNGQAESKNARGALKTLTLKIDTFKKVVAKTDGADKKNGTKALDDAGKVLKDLETQEKASAKLAEKAEKVYAALAKLKK